MEPRPTFCFPPPAKKPPSSEAALDDPEHGVFCLLVPGDTFDNAIWAGAAHLLVASAVFPTTFWRRTSEAMKCRGSSLLHKPTE